MIMWLIEKIGSAMVQVMPVLLTINFPLLQQYREHREEKGKPNGGGSVIECYHLKKKKNIFRRKE